MVGYIAEHNVGEEDHSNQASKSRNLKDPLENINLADLSFTDSFLDFDSIKEFFEDSPAPNTVSLGKIDSGKIEKNMEMGDHGASIETHSNPKFEELRSSEGESGSVVIVNDGSLGLEREENLDSSIEEEMGRVNLVGVTSPICGDGETVDDKKEMRNVSLVARLNSVIPDRGVNSEVVSAEMDTGNVYFATGSNTDVVTGSYVNNAIRSDKDESGSDSGSANESDSESASESSSSSNSSSSSSDEEGEMSDKDDEEEKEEEEEKVRVELRREVEEGEVEEGEIRDVNGKEIVCKNNDYEEEEDGDKMVEWSDVEFDEEEEGEGIVLRGPIRSKNELKVLPPVPPVDVALQPHHQMLPVGTILSIMSPQVIVEGLEKHNPLNEGSVLWITENRSPLGIVDEVFGPVQHPFYVVRYNSESEVPAGICQGTLISFVSEFANHVLNDKTLYKKGYDASGENDEELSDDVEFSDDEKEAEYRRMQKMSKRGINNQTVGNKKNNRKKVNNRNSNWKNNSPSRQQTLVGVGQSSPNQNQHSRSAIGASMNNSSSSNKGQDFRSGSGFFPPPFSPMVPPSGVLPSSDGAWLNGLPYQQSQNTVIPVGFPANNISWAPQNQPLHPCHMPFLQQFNPSQVSLPNSVVPGGQMNLYSGPSPWPGVIDQNCFNPAAFGMGFQFQPAQPTMSMMNVGGQGMMPHGQQMEPSSGVIANNVQPHPQQQFNLGASPNRGRKPYNHQRRGRFGGGRGWKSSK